MEAASWKAISAQQADPDPKAPELLAAILACPVCHSHLDRGLDQFRCQSCQRDYPDRLGIPALFHPESPFLAATATPTAPTASSSRSLLATVARRIRAFSPEMTMFLNEALFTYLNSSSPESLVLNLGSGVGRFDKKIRPILRLINFDVVPNGRTHVLGDAHYLPFSDNAIDVVFSNAVLEHVQRPWVVADEIYRVVKPGGRVLVNVPFLNIIHDTHDYFRFTDKGLEILFHRFSKVAGGVSAGPSSFFGPFLVTYLSCPIADGLFKSFTRRALSFLLQPLKYLDVPLRNCADTRLIADAFYYIGVKPLT